MKKKMRKWGSDLALTVGLILITAAAFCASTELGLLTAGVCCVGVGVLLWLGGEG